MAYILPGWGQWTTAEPYDPQTGQPIQSQPIQSAQPIQPGHQPNITPGERPEPTGVIGLGQLPIFSPRATPKEPFDSSKYQNDNKLHLLLCASGSVATIKIPQIARALLRQTQVSIRIVLTASAAQFLQGQSAEQPALSTIASFPNVEGIYQDADEWAVPWTRGAKILHIELRRWADLMIVAPLSANTLAKMVAGLCDGLLLSTMRAWDVTGQLSPPREVQVSEGRTWSQAKRSIIVAPAMNTAMWHHPLTGLHMNILEGPFNVKNDGFVEVLRPVEKTLACGDSGSGAMCDWKNIVRRIEGYFDLPPSTDAQIEQMTSTSELKLFPGVLEKGNSISLNVEMGPPPQAR